MIEVQHSAGSIHSDGHTITVTLRGGESYRLPLTVLPMLNAPGWTCQGVTLDGLVSPAYGATPSEAIVEFARNVANSQYFQRTAFPQVIA